MYLCLCLLLMPLRFHDNGAVMIIIKSQAHKVTAHVCTQRLHGT